MTLGTAVLPLAWRGHAAAATFGPVGDKVVAEAETLGYMVVALPEHPGENPPDALTEILRGTA